MAPIAATPRLAEPTEPLALLTPLSGSRRTQALALLSGDFQSASVLCLDLNQDGKDEIVALQRVKSEGRVGIFNEAGAPLADSVVPSYAPGEGDCYCVRLPAGPPLLSIPFGAIDAHGGFGQTLFVWYQDGCWGTHATSEISDYPLTLWVANRQLGPLVIASHFESFSGPGQPKRYSYTYHSWDWTGQKLLDVTSAAVAGVPPQVGQKADGSRVKEFLDGYLAVGEDQAGQPFDHGGGIMVHVYGKGFIQDFRGGRGGNGGLMQATPGGSAVWCHGQIWFDYWNLYGGPGGKLGYPDGRERKDGAAMVQHFEGGSVRWPGKGETTLD